LTAFKGRVKQVISRVDQPVPTGRRYSFGQILAVNAVVGLLAALVFSTVSGPDTAAPSAPPSTFAELDSSHLPRHEILEILGGRAEFDWAAPSRLGAAGSKNEQRMPLHPLEIASMVH
jgi:hypothetical protein